MHLTSETASTYNLPFVKGLTPYAHQVIQLQLIGKAFKEKKNVIIWNEAMTGAGKTLANYSYLIENKTVRALGVYPVNELVKDQLHSLEEHLPKQIYEEFMVWTSGELDQRKLQGETRLQQLKRESNRFTRVILTNPDYLMLIAQERLFASPQLLGDKRDLFHQIALGYPIQIFDEFHLYDVSQINLIAQWIAMLTSFYQERSFVFIFSSATPNHYFEQLVERAGVEIWKVNEELSNFYSEHHQRQVEERIYLEELELELVVSDLDRWNTSEVFCQFWNDFSDNYLIKYPEAKGLIIVDSIYEAQEIARFLREKKYEVGEVHGLSNRSNSREELRKGITVATSTVEVGVDFKGDIHKDYLIFEARNPGSFMQRLGRIGRGNRTHTWPPLYATAFVPEYVKNYIQNRSKAQILRSELKNLVMEAYRSTENFSSFIEITGGMMMLHAERELTSQFIDKPDRLDFKDRYRNILGQMYAISYEEQKHWYETWRRERTLEPLLSFRGSNNMEEQLNLKVGETFYPDIWFWDPWAQEIKRYDFRYIFRNYEFELTIQRDLLKFLERTHPEKLEETIKQMERFPSLGYAIVRKRRERTSRANLYWKIGYAGYRLLKEQRVSRVAGLMLMSDDNLLQQQLKPLNLSLHKSNTSWIVYIDDRDPFSLKAKYRLPPLFRLYRGQLGVKNVSIAFNVDAYKLWSVIRPFRSDIL